MSRTRVKSLRYKLNTEAYKAFPQHVDFEDCPDYIFETANASFVLSNHILSCFPKKDFAEVSIAREEIEPFLKKWGLYTTITKGGWRFQFDFLDAESETIQDEENLDPVVIRGSFSCSASIKISSLEKEYPPFPSNFVFSPNAETLWYRYQMYLNERDTLQGMAYFCLSYIEGYYGAGKRRNAAQKLAIDIEVLGKLGTLTSAKGDKREARKGKEHDFLPLREEEKNWINRCIMILIRRLAEHEHDSATMKPITMNDI